MGEYGFRPPEAEEEPRQELEPLEQTPERKKIKRELIIVIPKDFKPDVSQVRTALENIVAEPAESIEELRIRGYDYVPGRPQYPIPIIINAREIRGIESRNGWSGLVEGIGQIPQSVRHLQTTEEILRHVRSIADANREERNKVLDGIELVQYRSLGQRGFLVDSDGRHRILTLKVMSKLGCDVSISGIKVQELVR